MNKTVKKVTENIVERSKKTRESYLNRLDNIQKEQPFRHLLPLSSLAHGMAYSRGNELKKLLDMEAPDIAIITSYNDMLSAHHTYENFPQIIKKSVTDAGGVAQVASGVPAMCDGVTQGEPGMELSLMSRDVIAMSTAIGLTHNMFDGALLLGICDKIFPGLLMGALQFGHLPMIFVPGGPMTTGISNTQKTKARSEYAENRITRSEMLEVERKAYHSKGTCTFYGTANSNQLIAEFMGLHLPGASFVNAGTHLREALTRAASRRIVEMVQNKNNDMTLGRIVTEKNIVNAMVALLATGGSTNQTMHLVAEARAAGIIINWDDFSELSDVVPLLVRIYPNGEKDINGFQKAGGTAVLAKELLAGGYIHNDVNTVTGKGMEAYTITPTLEHEEVVWHSVPESSLDTEVISSINSPFDSSGGLKLLSGNLGRAVIKTSALKDGTKTFVKAPAMVFEGQHELVNAFHSGSLEKDFVAVIRFQGPKANGMPELHKLITPLGILMDRGFNVAMVTDGRLSGASGKVPAAIHLTPEAFNNGLLNKVRDGDLVRLDVPKGVLELEVDNEELSRREAVIIQRASSCLGYGREIFSLLRREQTGAEDGASALFSF